jgi:hypothetical protein
MKIGNEKNGLVGVDGSTVGFDPRDIDDYYQFEYRGELITVTHNGFDQDGVLAASVYIEPNRDYNLRDGVSDEDWPKWFALQQMPIDLTTNDEFMSMLKPLIDARLPWHRLSYGSNGVTWRRVPMVDANDLHAAEAAFHERHPGTKDLVSDWNKNVNSLVVGSQPFDNVLFYF